MNNLEKMKKNLFMSSLILVVLLFLVAYMFLHYEFGVNLDDKTKSISLSILFITFLTSIGILLFIQKSFDNVLNKFKKQSYYDNLTNLGNRQLLDNDILEDRLNILILINIKEFSLVNEFYGISIGNKVLKSIADRLNAFCNENGLNSYRISSDEYALLKYDEYFSEDYYVDLLEELHIYINSLRIDLEEFDEVLHVEIYSGITHGTVNLVEEAQMALKKAKEKSLPYMAYTDNIDRREKSSKIIKMKKKLKYALENKKVVPFFQEIRDRDEKIVKYEALVRIVDNENGDEKILYPSDFLSTAVNAGLYTYLAKDVLSQALSFFSDRDEKVSINFLPNDFFQPRVIDTFLEIVEKFENPKRIIMEITEQENVEDFNRLLKVVKRLRKLGVSIAIDDFGTGYSNYLHILQLKPDYLKIDGSLVRNVLEEEDSKILVKSIVHFAQDLGMKTIAEYVENKEIFELLKEYGVDEFQGYYFGKAENLLNKEY